MRIQIDLPPEIAARVRSEAEREHRDFRRQVEWLLMRAVDHAKCDDETEAAR